MSFEDMFSVVVVWMLPKAFLSLHNQSESCALHNI